VIAPPIAGRRGDTDAWRAGGNDRRSGCGRVQWLSAEAGSGPPGSAAQSANQPRDTLAYEHTLSVDLDKEALPGRLREIEAACNADTAARCTILESSLRWQERTPSASIRMRPAPGGVDSSAKPAGK
jgi:hypothetical protein